MNKEEIEKELRDAFDIWFANLLVIAPDITPYKDILFVSFVSGAQFDNQLTIRQLHNLQISIDKLDNKVKEFIDKFS